MKATKRRTLRSILTEIEDYLLPGDTKAGQLWSVLAALRGPDDGSFYNNDESYRMKAETTVHIRQRAFPRIRVRGKIAATFSSIKDFRLPGGIGHFSRHIRSAAKALRIKDGRPSRM